MEKKEEKEKKGKKGKKEKKEKKEKIKKFTVKHFKIKQITKLKIKNYTI